MQITLVSALEAAWGTITAELRDALSRMAARSPSVNTVDLLRSEVLKENRRERDKKPVKEITRRRLQEGGQEEGGGGGGGECRGRVG